MSSPLQTPVAAIFENPYRVMVVDDSAVVRGLTKKMLESDGKIKVVESAGDGQSALNKIVKADPEIVVLDLEMPVMDGLTAIPKILTIFPQTQIVISSTLSLKNAEISLHALQLGAKDYVTKPTTTEGLLGAEQFRLELMHKVKALAAAARVTRNIPLPQVKSNVANLVQKESLQQEKIFEQPFIKKTFKLRPAIINKPAAFAIGSSTGGPQALLSFFKTFPHYNIPIFLTQHMPPKFTTSLASHLSNASKWPVLEAQDGMIVEAGKAYLAPGDYHMGLEQKGDKLIIRTNQNPPENFCRPAVDAMLKSLIPVYGKKLLLMILTGMGNDGMKGADLLVQAGGQVIAQDEASSVVWGMPGAVAVNNLCTHVLPLEKLPEKASQIIQTGGG